MCQFSTVVENVTPVAEESAGSKAWEVVSSDPLNGERRELFDAVLVCSGFVSVHPLRVIYAANRSDCILCLNVCAFCSLWADQIDLRVCFPGHVVSD